MRLGSVGLILAFVVLATTPALAQTAPKAGDLPASIQDQRLIVRIANHDLSLAARIYRPAGSGPFPLVVIHHGTPVSMEDARSMKPGFARGARWFAAQGYVAVVALRPGFGDSEGPYLEPSGPCRDRNYVRDGRETAAVEAAIVSAAARLPDVDASRIVVVGQSAGGFGAIALADQPPSGVLGVISFAGGRGGDDHEHICGGADRLVSAARELGKLNHLPQLWLFAANDHFFPPPVGHAMFDAYRAGSTQPMKFVDLPPFGDDGHKTFAQADPSVWSPDVSAFLKDVVQNAPVR